MARSIHGDSDNDTLQPRTPARRAVRRYVDPDSDSDSEPAPSSAPKSAARTKPTPKRAPFQDVINLVSDSDSDSGDSTKLKKNVPAPAHAPVPVTPSRGLRGRVPASIQRLNVLKLIDDEAEEEEPKTKGKGRAKAKALWREVESEEDSGNESMGSLRDFIVPDDEGSESGSESERAPSPGPRRKRVEVLPKPKPEAKAKASNTKASTKIIEILDSDSDEDAVENVLGNVQDNEDEDDGGASDTGSVLHYSPPPRVRKLALPDLSALTLSDNDDSPSGSSTPAMTPKSRAKAATKIKAKAGPPGMSKKEWEAYRVQCAQAFFDDLDRDVFEFRLGAEGVGATLEWSAHLRTSAGNAQRKRVRGVDGSSKLAYTINLSIKVLNTKQQIRDTLAHEMCHLAAWVISNELKNPHGAVFKSWGRKVMRSRPDIEVTTKHHYEIEFKYAWQCTAPACAKLYQRHSKSIDTSRQVCGACRSRLAPCFETKGTTPFQAFLKANMKAAKAAMPAASHGDVMRALSKRWADAPEGGHVEYWRSVSAETAVVDM